MRMVSGRHPKMYLPSQPIPSSSLPAEMLPQGTVGLIVQLPPESWRVWKSRVPSPYLSVVAYPMAHKTLVSSG